MVIAFPAGLIIASVTVVTAIVSAVKWMIIPIVIVKWPLLLAGLTVGALLSWIGVADLATLKRRLKDRLRSTLNPKIQEALVGDGYLDKQNLKHPSVLRQLKMKIEELVKLTCDQLQSGME